MTRMHWRLLVAASLVAAAAVLPIAMIEAYFAFYERMVANGAGAEAASGIALFLAMISIGLVAAAAAILYCPPRILR